jgi:hypothetical protein
MFLFYIPAQIVEVGGTVVAHRPQTSETSSRPYLVVRLDNGATVHVRGYGHADYKPGRRLILTETTTQFFGYKRYKFNRYVEDPRETDRVPFHR